MMNLKFKRMISALLVIALLFSFSTPVFAVAVNVNDEIDSNITLERLHEFSAQESPFREFVLSAFEPSQYQNIEEATAIPMLLAAAINIFLRWSTSAIMARLTPIIATSSVNVARDNMSVITNAVRNADSVTRQGIQDSVARALRASGVPDGTARNIGFGVSELLEEIRWGWL